MSELRGIAVLLLLPFGLLIAALTILVLVQKWYPDTSSTELLVLIFVLALTFPILLKRARLKLDHKDPFRLYLGDSTYVLYHATGRVESASKMASTEVSGSGGGGYISGDERGVGGYINPITISSRTTIQDQFFLRQADGQVQTVQLKDWNFPVGDGHLVSAVWAIKDGESSGGLYLLMRNHTAGTQAINESVVSTRLLRWSGALVILIELAMLYFLAVVSAKEANGAVDSVTAFFVALAGVVVGSLVWSLVIESQFLARFRGNYVPRIIAALDAIAATPAS